jgi:hypothetical protein
MFKPPCQSAVITTFPLLFPDAYSVAAFSLDSRKSVNRLTKIGRWIFGLRDTFAHQIYIFQLS